VKGEKSWAETVKGETIWKGRGAESEGCRIPRFQLQRMSTPENRLWSRRSNRRDARGPARVQHVVAGKRPSSCRAPHDLYWGLKARVHAYRTLLPQGVEPVLGPGVASIRTPMP